MIKKILISAMALLLGITAEGCKEPEYKTMPSENAGSIAYVYRVGNSRSRVLVNDREVFSSSARLRYPIKDGDNVYLVREDEILQVPLNRRMFSEADIGKDVTQVSSGWFELYRNADGKILGLKSDEKGSFPYALTFSPFTETKLYGEGIHPDINRDGTQVTTSYRKAQEHWQVWLWDQTKKEGKRISTAAEDCSWPRFVDYPPGTENITYVSGAYGRQILNFYDMKEERVTKRKEVGGIEGVLYSHDDSLTFGGRQMRKVSLKDMEEVK